MNFEKARLIDGWLTDGEMAFLYKTAKSMKGLGAAVEIGSWKGKSTVCIASGLKRSKLYAVDTFHGDKECGREMTYSIFRDNLRRFGVSRRVVPMPMKSMAAAKKWKGPIEFLWIDGSHAYRDVKDDYVHWSPFVVNGGTIAFHDTVWKDPRKVVEKFILNGNFSRIGFVDSITYAVKGSGKYAGTAGITHRLRRLKAVYNPLRLLK